MTYHVKVVYDVAGTVETDEFQADFANTQIWDGGKARVRMKGGMDRGGLPVSWMLYRKAYLIRVHTEGE